MTFLEKIQFLNELIDNNIVYDITSRAIDNRFARTYTKQRVRNKLKVMMYRFQISESEYNFYCKWLEEFEKRPNFFNFG